MKEELVCKKNNDNYDQFKMNETTFCARPKLERQASYDDTDYLHEFRANTTETASNKEFIRQLANDFLRSKIHGQPMQACSVLNSDTTSETRNIIETTTVTADESAENIQTLKPFIKTAKTLRKVSMEMEKTNIEFFDKVCENMRIREENAEQAFKIVSEEVLDKKPLNWGRVVSLFTFGGKLAEWFWQTNQEDKIDEIEDWLTDSLSDKETWIKENGGWEGFNKTFPVEHKQNSYNWIKPSILICAGVSLAAVLTFKTME